MNKREFIVEVNEIFIFRAVAYYCRRELVFCHLSGSGLSVVDGIIKRKGKSPVLYIVFNVVNVINGHYPSEEGNHSFYHRGIFVYEKLLFSTAGNLFG